ncbi:YccT family protein [Marinomonas dokdonensis]|uniref:YccT family protein n=1 Tax=Marinomonas dokdonensis TaxID=328224 RepID=UPI004055706A
MLHPIKLALFGGLVSLAASPLLAATFEVPRAFEIMYVDQQAANKFGNDFKVEVAAGQHQLVVRFNKLLRQGGDTQLYRSEPFVLDVSFVQDTNILLQAPYVSSQKQAQEYAERPQFDLIDRDSEQSVNFQKIQLKTRSGFQNTRDYLAEVALLTEKSAASPSPVAPVLDGRLEDIALEMLKFWYNKASLVTREEVQSWRSNSERKVEVSDVAAEMLNFWSQKANVAQQDAFLAWTLK